MIIDRDKLKLSLQNETRVWLKNNIEMSIKFCGGFEAFVLSLEKTARKRDTKILYGSSDQWRIVYNFQSESYNLVDLRKE